MVIQCPSCQTRYRIDSGKVRPGVSKVRCSRCGHEFVADAAGSAGQEGAAESPQRQPEASQAQADGSSGLFEEFDEASAEEGKSPPAGKSRLGRLLLWLLILLVFSAAGLAGYLFLPQIREMVPFLQSESGQQTRLTQKTATEEGSVEDIALMDVRQYMVQNEKIGRILVIEGKAVNQSDIPKKMIKLRAKLYDAQGQALREKEFLCGNTVSLFQLQVLGRGELESALNSKVGVLTNNSNLGSGQEVEFMTVFPNPDKGLNEFSLKVIKAANVETD